MGKVEDEQSLPTAVNAQNSDQNAEYCCRVRGLVRFRCVSALVLGVAVLISAIFWLPFFNYGGQGDTDLDSMFGGHDIVASFTVEKSVSLLEDNILQLEDDIFDGLGGIPTTKVEIVSLENTGSNNTKVVFAVDSDVKNMRVSSTAQSLTRASFVSLVIQQSSLHLTASLFGNTSSFKVLKFTGGITVSPPQSAFLMQKVQILFNFTLNFSIDQVQENFAKLTSQLKSGLHLAPYDNLYISLTNLKGSTVAPPTTVQSQVLLAVGIHPSNSRLKQLAQTIAGSHTENLGLNNTVFGRVKQVRLSSVLQHSLHGGDGSSPSPSPSPQLHPHRHHHHHHHHHHNDAHLAPAMPPTPGGKRWESSSGSTPTGAPTPAPETAHEAKPPGCHFGHKIRFPRKSSKHSSPAVAPLSQQYASPSPSPQVPAPSPSSAFSPLPNVIFAHVQPPSRTVFDAEPPDTTPSASPLSSASSGGMKTLNLWVFLLFILLVLHL